MAEQSSLVSRKLLPKMQWHTEGTQYEMVPNISLYGRGGMSNARCGATLTVTWRGDSDVVLSTTVIAAMLDVYKVAAA